MVPREASLVVDDHDGFRRLARKMLEAAAATAGTPARA
jgi:hypothetical protein